MKKINIDNILASREWKRVLNCIIQKLRDSFTHWTTTNPVKLSLRTLSKQDFKHVFKRILFLDINNKDSELSEINDFLMSKWIKLIDSDFILLLYIEYLWVTWVIRSSFISLLKKNNLNICPYCNFQPINDCQLNYDHIFDKDSFPILAFSLKNLLPTCSYCNQKKSTTHYYNFYEDDIIAEFNFKFNFDSIDNHKELTKYRIGITKKNNSTKLNNYLNKFIVPLYTKKDWWVWDICLNNLKKIRDKEFYNSFGNFIEYEDSDYWIVFLPDLEIIHKIPLSKFKLSALNKKECYDIDL